MLGDNREKRLEGKAEQDTTISLETVLNYINYNYVAASEDQFKSKQYIFVNYMDQRKESLAQTQKKMTSLIKQSDERVSLIIVRDIATSSLSLAVTDEEKVSELHLDMNQLSNSDNIWFHK